MKNKSMSLFTNYPKACLDAANNDDMFNIFKSMPEYNQVLEHTNVEFGQNYLDIIKRDNPQLLEERYINEFKKNDTIGSAYIHNYESVSIAPSTLRYIKVLSDLIKIFGNLNGFKIAEIGGGYGGQCKIIKDYFQIDDYHIVDLYEANQLTRKYLDKLNVNNVRSSTSDELIPEKYDLIISNYAYTELDRDLQNNYKTNIINSSDNGYITCNFINGFIVGSTFDTYSKSELLSIKNETTVLGEEPLTGPTNFILIWKK